MIKPGAEPFGSAPGFSLTGLPRPAGATHCVFRASGLAREAQQAAATPANPPRRCAKAPHASAPALRSSGTRAR